MNIIQAPSKNFGSRNGHKVDTIVIHATDGFFPGDLEWLRGAPGSQVSSHYLIAPLGAIYSLVDEKDTAYHAGLIVKPTAHLRKENGTYVNPNLYSIGIETSLKVPGTISTEQWGILKELVKNLCDKYQIPIDRQHILAHREIRSDKTCPGSINVDLLVSELAISPPVQVKKLTEAEKVEIMGEIRTILNKY